MWQPRLQQDAPAPEVAINSIDANETDEGTDNDDDDDDDYYDDEDDGVGDEDDDVGDDTDFDDV